MNIYQHTYTVEDNEVDCFGYLKPSMLLFYAQDMAGRHCVELSVDYDTMAAKRLFWAVIRHRVQITRMPRQGEKLTLQTWPMPTTRVAYPRATVCYDEKGEEVFRIISLWVIMNLDTRAMILPGKSGIQVAGLCKGTELAPPASLAPAVTENRKVRTVRYSDLDRNGHMNNCRYLEWAADLLPSPFHRDHQMKEFVVCYLSEAREGESLELAWHQDQQGFLQVEILRREEAENTGHSRVCAVKIQY